MDVEPGIVKGLHVARGRGHLCGWPVQWQLVQVRGAVGVGLEDVHAS